MIVTPQRQARHLKPRVCHVASGVLTTAGNSVTTGSLTPCVAGRMYGQYYHVMCVSWGNVDINQDCKLNGTTSMNAGPMYAHGAGGGNGSQIFTLGVDSIDSAVSFTISQDYLIVELAYSYYVVGNVGLSGSATPITVARYEYTGGANLNSDPTTVAVADYDLLIGVASADVSYPDWTSDTVLTTDQSRLYNGVDEWQLYHRTGLLKSAIGGTVDWWPDRGSRTSVSGAMTGFRSRS